MSLPKLPAMAALAIFVTISVIGTASAQMMAPDSATPNDQAQPEGGSSSMPGGIRGMIGHELMSRGMMRGDMMDRDTMRGDMMDRDAMSYGMMREMMPMGPMHRRMMRIMFAIADTNGDGALSFEEVTAIDKRIFDLIDANKDGKVTPDELMAFMEEIMPRAQMHRGMMRIMFAIADTNGDGALSFEEVTAIHKRIFDLIDANKDGKVTPDELLAFMMGQ